MKTRVSQFNTRQQATILREIQKRIAVSVIKEMPRTEFNALIVSVGNELYK